MENLADSQNEIIDLLNQGRVDLALTLIDKQTNGSAPSVELRYLRAIALIRSNLLAQAKDELLQLLSLKPDHRYAKLLLDEIAFSDETTIVSFENINSLIDSALELLKAGEGSKALELTRKASAIMNNFPNLNYIIGMCHIELASLSEAKRFLEAELTLYPDNPEVAELLRQVTEELSRCNL